MAIDIIGKNAGAISAYANTAKITGGAPGIDSRDGKGGTSFADMIKTGVQELVDTQRASEAISAQAVTGKADLVDVVRVVGEAEMTLQTVVAVRDKMIGAYQDIMRMPM